MYKITIYYWFESPFTGRATGDISIQVRDEFEVSPTLKGAITSGLILPISDGLKRYVAPHQIIDTVIEQIKETQDGKIEEAHPTGDEILPVKTTRSRKAKDTPTD